jgi:hypothetical protein
MKIKKVKSNVKISIKYNTNNTNNRVNLFCKILNIDYNYDIENLINKIDNKLIPIEFSIGSLILCERIKSYNISIKYDLLVVTLYSICNMLLSDYNNDIYGIIINNYLNKDDYVKLVTYILNILYKEKLFIDIEDVTSDIFYTCLNDYNNLLNKSEISIDENKLFLK